MRLECQAYKPKHTKVGQKGRGLRHETYFYNFETPLCISEMGKVRNVKFGVRIDRQVYKPKHAKLGQKDRGLRHVPSFYYFWTRSGGSK